MTNSTDPDLGEVPDRAPTASAQGPGHTSLRRVLDDVCRELHDARSADVHIVLDEDSRPHATHEPTARVIFQQLLWGLVDACNCLRAGRLELHVRPSGTGDRVLTSVDILPDRRIDEYRSRVLGCLVEQRDDPVLGHDLDGASVAIRDAGGFLMCREGDDGRLWMQVGLPAS
jgi:hypothetical protein